MIGTLIPQTRELLQHVRKLSQLAGDDDRLARARARRARRALKVHALQYLICGWQSHRPLESLLLTSLNFVQCGPPYLHLITWKSSGL